MAMSTDIILFIFIIHIIALLRRAWDTTIASYDRCHVVHLTDKRT
jgi:hypothetical protein